MSLLKPDEKIADKAADYTLHSTMSLLKRRPDAKNRLDRVILYIPLCLY